MRVIATRCRLSGGQTRAVIRSEVVTPGEPAGSWKMTVGGAPFSCWASRIDSEVVVTLASLLSVAAPDSMELDEVPPVIAYANWWPSGESARIVGDALAVGRATFSMRPDVG